MKNNFLIGLFAIIAAVTLTGCDNWPAKTVKQEEAHIQQENNDENTDVVSDAPANFQMSENFIMSVLADNLDNPRTIMMGPDGNLWVTLTAAGKVVEIIDKDQNGKAESVNTLIEGLDKPHGLEKRCHEDICEIYIAEVKRLASYELKDGKLQLKEKLADLPDGGRHFTRSLQFLADPNADDLLISIGSTCDVCNEEDARHGSVQVFNLNDKELKPYARGLRNAVFMTMNPITKQVWSTEMGRDFLGDELPPDELNILEKDKFYGWPICYGQNVHDSKFDQNVYIRNPCMDPFETPAEIAIPAHSAPLGLAFIPKDGWAEEYQGDLLVAYHGSWNRTEYTGYKVVRYDFDQEGKLLKTEDFLTGFLDGKSILGRPAGIAVMPNGKIFITDDKAGKVYQLNYSSSSVF